LRDEVRLPLLDHARQRIPVRVLARAAAVLQDLPLLDGTAEGYLDRKKEMAA
jgi:hypothetical protein